MREDRRKVVTPEQYELFAYAWATFHTVEGQRLLEHLEERFNSRTSFDPDSTHTTAFHEGRRDVVLYINQLMRAAKTCRAATPDDDTYLTEGDSLDA